MKASARNASQSRRRRADRSAAAGTPHARRNALVVRARSKVLVVRARRSRVGALAVGLACALGLCAATALAASSVSLKEAASLKRVGKAKGFDLTEKGTASGTINGPIDLSLHVVSTDKVTATVTVSPKGGALYGSGSASYHVDGATAYFGGSLSITKGSGSWSGAHASDLKFSGEIARANDNVTVNLSGTLYK